MALLIPFFAMLAWVVLPVVAWRLGRRWVRLATRWKWAVRFLAVAVVLMAIGLTQLAPASLPRQTDPALGDTFFVVSGGSRILMLAVFYAALGVLHAALAGWHWPIMQLLASLQFWLWHLGQFSGFARRWLAGAFATQPANGPEQWLRRLDDIAAYLTDDLIGAHLIQVSLLLLLLLLALSLYRRLRPQRTAPPDAL